MTVVSSFQPDTFYVPGYCSGDADKCTAFYTALFGWDPSRVQMEGGEATFFKVNNVNAAGMYQMADDRKAAGVRPHWNSYMCVADIQDIVNKTREAYGKVVMEPSSGDGYMMGTIEDPTGARLSLWQFDANKEDPCIINEPGALYWTELCTTDAGRAGEFYTKVFGWRAVPFEGGPVPYTIFEKPDSNEPVGGMFQITPEMQGMPSQWLPYFAVADADKSGNKTESLGGKVHGLMNVPGVGRIGMLSDAEGGGFAIITPAMRTA